MRLLLLLGALGGAWLLGYAFIPAECAPVTGVTEILCNRLWTPALLGMTAGFVGIRRWAAAAGLAVPGRWLSILAGGMAVMAIGNLGEYWVFFDWPHRGPDGWLRGTLWMSFLLGALGVLVAAVGSGIVLLSRRNPLDARILGSLLVASVSLVVFVGLLATSVLALSTSLFGLVAIARARRTAGPDPA